MAIWRVTVRTAYAAPGGPGYSTFHFRDGGLATLEAELDNALIGLRDAYELLTPQLCNTTVFSCDGVFQDVGGTQEINRQGWTISGDLQPQNYLSGGLAVVCGWRTENRSRRGRGRTYLSGWPTSASVDGTPNNLVMAAVSAFGNSLVNFGADNDGAFAVYSPTDEEARDITGRNVRDVWAFLRSRRE